MLSLNGNEKVTCDHCGTQTTKSNLPRDKKSCSAGKLFCPNFPTKSKNDRNYHFAKKHSAPKHKVTLKCKLCYTEFPGFHALRQHKDTQHGFPIKTANVDPDDIINKIFDANLEEELRLWHFFHVDSELERPRRKVFNYAMKNINAELVEETLDLFFNNLKCAAKVNEAFGSFVGKVEDCGIRYFYAHENNTLLDRSKFVCTKDDLAKLKDILNKTDVIEYFSRETMNTMWRFCKLTNLTVFAVSLKDVPMGCRYAV